MEEEEIVEEVLDDTPMHIIDRLYVGSIDAALNTPCCAQKSIGALVSVLSATEYDLFSIPSRQNIRCIYVSLEDKTDANLIAVLPEVLFQLENLLEKEQVNVLVHWYVHHSFMYLILNMSL